MLEPYTAKYSIRNVTIINLSFFNIFELARFSSLLLLCDFRKGTLQSVVLNYPEKRALFKGFFIKNAVFATFNANTFLKYPIMLTRYFKMLPLLHFRNLSVYIGVQSSIKVELYIKLGRYYDDNEFVA